MPSDAVDDVEHEPAGHDREDVEAVVATFERPMYRPDEARGMMSVISAQSTARNVPAEAPKSAAPTTATGTAGASAAMEDARRSRSTQLA